MVYESAFLRKSGKAWKGVLKYKDESGEWRQRQKSFGEVGKREAQRGLEAWRAEMEEAAQREAGANPNETVADYVSRYVESRASFVERSTLSGYRQLLKRQIAPYIGGVPLDSLDPDAVQDWVNRLSDDYMPVTVRKAFTLLKSAMTQAVERDRLLKNPTRTVKPPKLAAPKPNSLDEGSRARLMAVLESPGLSRALLGVKIAVYTGMREGEVCGLRWRDVDADACSIMVSEAIGGESGKGYYVKEPKTGGSRRAVYFPESLADSLRERLADLKRECIAAGVGYSPSLYVIGYADGSFMPPHYLHRKWKSLADALELMGTQGKRPTFHDLRHTYATTAITHGVDIKTVSSQLGHANAAMTLNTYASADPDAKRRAAQAMGEAFAQDAARGRGENVVKMDRAGLASLPAEGAV